MHFWKVKIHLIFISQVIDPDNTQELIECQQLYNLHITNDLLKLEEKIREINVATVEEIYQANNNRNKEIKIGNSLAQAIAWVNADNIPQCNKEKLDYEKTFLQKTRKHFMKKINDIEITKEKKIGRLKKAKPITADQTTLDKYMDLDH